MKSRKRIKWIACLLALVVLCSVRVPAFAAEAADIDWSRTGSLSLTLKAKDTKTAVSDAEITLVQVARAENDGGKLKYTPLAAYAAWSFADLSASGLPGELAAYVSENAALTRTTQKTDAGGVVQFSDLKLGLYLVMQTKAVSGYSTISPFLVMVPGEENGAWVYDVTGAPKAEPETESEETVQITVKKVWNDKDRGSTARPKSVTVQLMKGTAVVETVTLDEANGWTHTWTELAASGQWTVQEINVPTGYTVKYEKTVKGSEYTFTVTNSAENPDNPKTPDTPDSPKLPQTGQLNWPVPILALAGLALLMLGAVLRFGKREERDA